MPPKKKNNYASGSGKSSNKHLHMHSNRVKLKGSMSAEQVKAYNIAIQTQIRQERQEKQERRRQERRRQAYSASKNMPVPPLFEDGQVKAYVHALVSPDSDSTREYKALQYGRNDRYKRHQLEEIFRATGM